MKYVVMFLVIAGLVFGSLWIYNTLQSAPGSQSPTTTPSPQSQTTTPPSSGNTQVAAGSCYNYGVPETHECSYTAGGQSYPLPSCTSSDGCTTYCNSCAYNICTAPGGGPLKKFWPAVCDKSKPAFFAQVKEDPQYASCLATSFGQQAVDDWAAGKVIVWPADALTAEDTRLSNAYIACYNGYQSRACAKMTPEQRAKTYGGCDGY